MIALLDWIFGCSHSTYTFPLTVDRRRGPYVVCINCGKELKYSWAEMKVVPWPKEEPVKQQQINPALEIQRGEARIR